MKGKFIGLIVVTKKYDESFNNHYYHQAYQYLEGLWKPLYIQANTLKASQEAFSFQGA